jgi:hypothetical protein
VRATGCKADFAWQQDSQADALSAKALLVVAAMPAS